MNIRFIGIVLLGGGLAVSCGSPKGGGGGTVALVDNGGYSDGGFYGDAAAPVPSGYPRDGQTFATRGGVPFRHNDPVGMEDPVVDVLPEPPPVMAPRAPMTMQAGAVVAGGRSEPVRRESVQRDPYAVAYATGSAPAGAAGLEVPVVRPYVERVEPVVVTPAAKPSQRVASKPVAKKPGSVAVKAGSAKTGKAVKTVYHPPGRSGAAAKKPVARVRVHDIKRGDTLSGLASRYGVTVAQLKKRNKLAGDTIVVGKRLAID